MKQEDLQMLEQAVRNIIYVIERHNVQEEDAAERRALFRFVEPNKKEKDRRSKPLKFTKKEIESMPIQYRNLFFTENAVAHIRIRKDNLYEIRCQVDGKKITATSKTLATAKRKFIGKLQNLADNPEKENKKEKITFYQYAQEWLDTVKRPTVKSSTMKDYLYTFKNHLYPIFGTRTLESITRQEVQQHLNDLLKEGKSRAAHKQQQLLNAIFEYAIADELITRSPMTKIKLPIHESINGTALTIEEEQNLVLRYQQSETLSAKAFIFMIYSGIRRSEMKTARIEGEWIEIVSAKQRKGKQERTRRIPISPQLKKYIPNVESELETFKNLYINRLSRTFKEWMPNHHLHDLRHTFITRCQECGIPREVVSLWAGHKADNTMTSNVYTHFSDSFQLQEIKKFDY